MGDLLYIWLISLGGFLALWPLSLVWKDASVVDFWWGPGVGAMVLAAWWLAGMPMAPGILALLLLCVLWSGRLGIHLGIRRIQEGEEDARYREMRAARDPGWWWKSLFIVFVLQSVLQGIIAAPLVFAMLSGVAPALSPALVVATLIVGFGLWMQTVADIELDRHRAADGHGKLLTTGLRAVVRHPNYLGEILVWVGHAALAVLAGVWWAPLSAIIVTLLLRYVSGVPLIEDRMARTRPDAFPPYRDRVPALVPRFSDLRAYFNGRSSQLN
ncbi:MAG: DUF1295 domain-containing protein [Pseudomonadota bacterium]